MHGLVSGHGDIRCSFQLDEMGKIDRVIDRVVESGRDGVIRETGQDGGAALLLCDLSIWISRDVMQAPALFYEGINWGDVLTYPDDLYLQLISFDPVFSRSLYNSHSPLHARLSRALRGRYSASVRPRYLGLDSWQVQNS